MSDFSKYDLEFTSLALAKISLPSTIDNNINLRPTIIKKMVDNNYDLVPNWDEECDDNPRLYF